MKERFDENNLKNYVVPEWFEDAKFGIFIHYGVYSEPGFGDEWYGHWMYLRETKSWGGDDIYEYHRKTYGGVEKFGYKDFIPKFIEDIRKYRDYGMAEQWAELFKQAGAKYVMPVGIHHDSFALYDSDVQSEYNSVKQAGIDYCGLLKDACNNQGLHFGISNHFAENRWFFDKVLAAGTDITDPAYRQLYGFGLTEEEHVKKWYDISMEIIGKYHPELIYYDFDLQKPEYVPYKRKMLANYYNMEQDSEELNGVICCYKYGAFEDGEAILDVERGALQGIREMHWQTDTSVGTKSWGYTKNEVFGSPHRYLCELVDTVSKNGNMLLNIGPMPDGTIPEKAREILLKIGKWLQVNGEAIYATRPWKVYGEGPNVNGAKGEFSGEVLYDANDIRYTRSKDHKYVYGIVMGKADKDVIVLTEYRELPESVEILATGHPLAFELTENGLKIYLKENMPDDMFVIKIKM